MLVTETEAKEKRCGGPEGCGESRFDKVTLKPARYCIGSQCMNWRWGTSDYPVFKRDGTLLYATKVGVEAEYEKAGYPQCGCCGLAGRP